MIGFRFSEYIPEEPGKANFQQLLDIFLQLLNITSGDVAQSLSLLSDLDKRYGMTGDDYGIGNFIDDLKDRGYIKEEENNPSKFIMTAKSEQSIRKKSLEEIFSKLKKAGKGNHNTPYSGVGEEKTSDRRDYMFGDTLDQIDMT
jgi:uncharacterized protein with von Willebrand factor type A (vWA) domain